MKASTGIRSARSTSSKITAMCCETFATFKLTDTIFITIGCSSAYFGVFAKGTLTRTLRQAELSAVGESITRNERASSCPCAPHLAIVPCHDAGPMGLVSSSLSNKRVKRPRAAGVTSTCDAAAQHCKSPPRLLTPLMKRSMPHEDREHADVEVRRRVTHDQTRVSRS